MPSRHLLTTFVASFIVTLIVLLIIAPLACAGVMEVSATYSTHTSAIDQNNFTEDQSVTGSFAWYFFSQSAIEASYTYGFGEQSLEANGDSGATVYYEKAEMIGLDLVLSLLPPKTFIQPFIRGGGLHIFKKMYEQFYDGTVDQYGDTVNAIVPSYGGGVNIHFTQTFAIKASYDRWESGVDGDAGIWDDAFRGGVAWYF